MMYMAEMKLQYTQFMVNDKQMPEIDIPPEVAYVISYIQLIAFSGMGKNASSETRAQAIFPIEDVIINMKIADFCYPLKSAIMLFLEHIYFDVEKDMNEDFIGQVWAIVEYVADDLQKFVEVMQRSKRQGGAAMARGGAEGGTLDLVNEMGSVEELNKV